MAQKFGKYAASIQKTGEGAYKNRGVSQSVYLATANKMGALFQGSGLEQQKSLELTEKAMQRAADMSAVMGIEMSVALEAVTGAANANVPYGLYSTDIAISSLKSNKAYSRLPADNERSCISYR